MIPPKTKPAFLDRDAYQTRRLHDAIRAMPVAGTVLLLIPLMWGASTRSSDALVYVFLAWLVLIIASAFISRLLPEPLAEDDEQGPL